MSVDVAVGFFFTDVCSANDLSSATVEHTLCELSVLAISSDNADEQRYDFQLCDRGGFYLPLCNDLAGVGSQFDVEVVHQENCIAMSCSDPATTESSKSSRIFYAFMMIGVLTFGFRQYRVASY